MERRKEICRKERTKDWREGMKYCLERRKVIIRLERRKAICAGEKGQNKDWREGRK